MEVKNNGHLIRLDPLERAAMNGHGGHVYPEFIEEPSWLAEAVQARLSGLDGDQFSNMRSALPDALPDTPTLDPNVVTRLILAKMSRRLKRAGLTSGQ